MTKPTATINEEGICRQRCRSPIISATSNIFPVASLLLLTATLAKSGASCFLALSPPLSSLSSGTHPANLSRRLIRPSSPPTCRHHTSSRFSNSRKTEKKLGCRSLFTVQVRAARDDDEGVIIDGDCNSDIEKNAALHDNTGRIYDEIETDATLPGNGYPVKIHNQGHAATIWVRENEPILQALERFSPELALSSVPHECRRGSCLTCAAHHILPAGDENASGSVRANVDHGLSPEISSMLDEGGFILACCSYVTGPGVELELDQADRAWDTVYRRRICGADARQVGMEARAKFLRSVDEENVAKWKRKMELFLTKKEND